MLIPLKVFVSRYFNDDVQAYADYADIPVSTCYRQIRDSRRYMEVTDSGFRSAIVENSFPIRACEINYDHFNPYFLRFSFLSMSYSVVQNGQSNDGTPIYLLECLDEGSTGKVNMKVYRSPLTSFTSILILASSSGLAIFELIFDELGNYFILHVPYQYTFLDKGLVIEPDVSVLNFSHALEMCQERGWQMNVRTSIIYQPD
ncbi:hypothetical protein L1D14_03860 [Vibrio tubiashii]|uniref:hypothetical protein n=1 Tax=Vibrio tubiashii TaxID=29498 RepID=UPI001EFE409B|nr:hypothetical protein [Vibrio tubiashii]MCG9575366.1 hypothetical protein [Vibrio tubiashii]